MSLILAAMINTKQSGIGLVLALAGAAIVIGAAERGAFRRLVGETARVLVPAALLYAVWRYFVAHAGVAELEPLPFNEWNWALFPATFAGIVGSIAEKPVYFAAEIVSFVCLALLWRRQGWSQATRFLAFNAAVFILYNGYLMVTYIAHFSAEMAAEAHSYFRYNTHLSLVLVLSLALAVREFCPALQANPRVWRISGRTGSRPRACRAGRTRRAAALRHRDAAAAGLEPGRRAETLSQGRRPAGDAVAGR